MDRIFQNIWADFLEMSEILEISEISEILEILEIRKVRGEDSVTRAWSVNGGGGGRPYSSFVGLEPYTANSLLPQGGYEPRMWLQSFRFP